MYSKWLVSRQQGWWRERDDRSYQLPVRYAGPGSDDRDRRPAAVALDRRYLVAAVGDLRQAAGCIVGERRDRDIGEGIQRAQMLANLVELIDLGTILRGM